MTKTPQTSTPQGVGAAKHAQSGFGMLDTSVVQECDTSVWWFSYVILIGIIGSALMRIVVFTEILEFLNFNPKFLLATLTAVTLIGVPLDHTFFRASLERVSQRGLRTTGQHIKMMLPMFSTGLTYPFLVRLALLAPTLVLMLVIMLKASIGPIETVIAQRETAANSGLVTQVEADLKLEETALHADVTAAETRITDVQTAWEKENALATQKVNALYQEVDQLQTQSSKLYTDLAALEQDKRNQERIMYCEKNHSTGRPIRGCEDASGSDGEGPNFRQAERSAGLLADQIEAQEALIADNAKVQQALVTRIDAVRLTPLDTAAQQQQLRQAQERLTRFMQVRANEAQKRLNAAGPVTLDPTSLALQLSALSQVWSEGGVIMPLALVAVMFAVFDLAFALIALSFAPKEYIAKLGNKMLGYEFKNSEDVHGKAADQAPHINAAIEASLDVEIQANTRLPSFIRAQAKKRRAGMAERSQFSSALRQQFFHEVSVAANSNGPRRRR